MADSRIFRTWMKRIVSGEITKGQQNAFGNYLSGGGRRTNLTGDELARLKVSLDQAARAGSLRVSPEQTRHGLSWLREHLPAGEPRNLIRPDTFDHFEFRGYYEQEIHLGNLRGGPHTRYEYRPIYRVVANDGRWFDYVVAVHRTDAMNHMRPNRGRRIRILDSGGPT